MTVLYTSSIIFALASVVSADNEVRISWGTVGVAWALTTVTTVFIVVIAMKVQRVLRRKHKKSHAVVRRDSGTTRESKRSGASTNTRTTLLSRGNHRNSNMNSDGKNNIKSAYMKRSVSDESAQNRRRTDYTSKWCTEKGLNENTAKMLRHHGFIDEKTLNSLRVEDVPTLGLISKAEECVLRRVLFETHLSPGPLTLDIQEPSSGQYGYMRSVSDNFSPQRNSHNAVRPGPSCASSQTGTAGTGASTPLLDKTMSFEDLSQTHISFKAEPGMRTVKSYDVIEEGKSRMFGAASAIDLPEIAEQPAKHRAGNPKDFNGLLSDKGLYKLASEIGIEWQQLAALLSVPNAIIQQIKLDHIGNTRQQIYEMLRLWRDTASGSKETIKGTLQAQLEHLGRRDLADKLLQEQVTGSMERMSMHSIV